MNNVKNSGTLLVYTTLGIVGIDVLPDMLTMFLMDQLFLSLWQRLSRKGRSVTGCLFPFSF